ncbi:U3 small nucleolar RNA-associated protein 10 [Blastomyces dermatitidis ER-3]|uniref:U3 small nucleolar RNA-associated protein 10 n=1 Tax=Ajellomyces dermatitidis (strain ER-3 / ATCC MYA-2586) TaxID=559297 RepID=A0ABP2F3P3_AJEDR|nr:U3 small nucleolar RNA-associated protein 10 [Blastomyces dermatitidis ER-3]EEQ91542.1 U3 small nucleolar RNA-associated protein 10 [Blastomyces dermatitidis ER-3]
MASSLAAQLSQIAATSTHQLDLKAQRVAHSKSLLFEQRDAVSQSFDTIYQICHEGFQELCALDSRFVRFRRTIFSEQSKSEDRLEMNAEQNQELDTVLEEFLALVGSRLLLQPAIKAVEWLVRRFGVHEHNTAFVLLTFLPYHTTDLFKVLLSILPENLPPAFKVLNPYRRSLTLPPRHPIVHSASTNKLFFSSLNNYVLQVSKAQAHYQGLLSFWAGVVTEALANMLDSASSGRREVERRNKEDVLLQILPVLHSGFGLTKAPEIIIGCYMLCVVIAKKTSLEDTVLDGLLEAVAGTWTQETRLAAMTCLSVLAQHKSSQELPRNVVKSIICFENSLDLISELCARSSVTGLLLGLIHGCTKDISEQKDLAPLKFVNNIIQRDILEPEALIQAMVIVLRAANDVQKSGRMVEESRTILSEIIQHFTESESLAPLLQNAIQESSIDINALEMGLETVIESNQILMTIEDVEMEDVADTGEKEDMFARSLEGIPKSTKQASFLEGPHSAIYGQLAHTFVLAIGNKEKLLQFIDLPILNRGSALQDTLYLSFLMRFCSGPYSPASRAAAVQLMADCLTENASSCIDMQATLPYIISALCDPSERVRREAASLLAAFGRSCAKIKKEDEHKPQRCWGYNTLYGKTERSKSLRWLSPRDVYRVAHRALLPALEEYVLEPAQIRNVLESAIRGTSASGADNTKTLDSELKKTVRLDLFIFLCSHTIITPLYAVKLRLLKILNRLGKVGSTSRTEELSPLLDQWKLLTDDDIVKIANTEQVDVHELEEQVLDTVSGKRKNAVDILLSSVTSQSNTLRPAFAHAVFKRLNEIWPSLTEDSEVSAADTFLQMALGLSAGNEGLSNLCRDLLRTVDLSGPILNHFLYKISTAVIDTEPQAPAAKRRRTSQNNMVAMTTRDPKELSQIIGKVTFILELIDGSNPENYPQLLGGLFQTLAAVHHLKLQLQAEMSYLLSLVLGIMLAIINKAKLLPKHNLDTSVIRADMIIDCIRTSQSPQVQNTALLLVAGLATISPEIILHSVMPIFTFMGSNVLKKDDEYSALVIDQTIDQVVPPLIQSLRNQKRDVVSGTSELLLSFTAAFEHIPSHRRLRLFEALITKLGAGDFLFAVFAMLANRYGTDRDVVGLMTSLAANTGVELQLNSYTKYLDLVADALLPKPNLSRTLLGVGGEDGRDPPRIAADLLQALSHLLQSTSLKTQMTKIFTSDDADVAPIHNLFSRILEQLLALSDTVRANKPVSKACGDALGSLLGTLSLIDFLDTIEVLLRRPDDDLRRRVLRLLESRLNQSHERDSASQSRVLAFLPTLVGILESSHDVLLKHASVACIDKIAEKYGKKDPTSVVEAAKVVAGENCIGQPDDRIRVIGILYLASVTEVVGEAIIPVLPAVFSRAFGLLKGCLESNKKNAELHDAIYSLISALITHVPWMISDDHLNNILCLSFKSAAANLPEDSNENRHEALNLLARRLDVSELFKAVESNWSFAVSEGPQAIGEVLEVTSLAIEKNPKSSTVKNVPTLTKLLEKALDIRRTQFSQPTKSSYGEDDVNDIESQVNDMGIKMIYKLNDTVFRPLFVQLTEWAAGGLPKSDGSGRLLRLTTFYKFLGAFFGTLQSIVTSYSSYIIESTVEILKTARCNDKDSRGLWLATMRMLRSSFEHDQDEFWQSPTHLAAISGPLVTQLSHSTNQSSLKLITAEAIPTIVELAAAADSPDNHKELNSAIMKLMRPGVSSTGRNGGDNPYTRLAAVKCEFSLTERLGEEWLALLPEMLPYISELMEDDDENVEKEVRRWVLAIEEVLGEKLDDMLV